MKKFVLFIALALPILIAANRTVTLKEVVLEKNMPSAEDKIRWYTFKEAQAAMEANPKKILVDVYTKWCGPCKMMMKNTFTNKKIIEYINENFYAVKFDAEGPNPVEWKGVEYTNPTYDPNKQGRNGMHQLTMQIAPVNGRVAYPTLTYIDEELNILTPVQGYHTPQQLEPILRFFGDDHYKTTTYEEYIKTFKSQF